jgi:deoxyribonuclease-4
MAPQGFRFGTVGAPASTPSDREGRSVGAVKYLAGIGLGAYELAWVQSVRVTEASCAAIRNAAREADVALSVHAPYYINLNASDDEWPKGRKRLMDAAHYGYLAGATDIVFHPGSYFGRPAAEVLEVAIARLKGCVDELRQSANPVRLRPEVMGKPAMLGSLDDVLTMGKEVEGVEPCLDFAHLHARAGDGSMNAYEEWQEVLRRYRRALGPKSLKQLHCHLSGIEYSPRGERRHLMLPESDFDLNGLMRALAELNCGGRIVCESPVMDEDARRIQNAWRRTQRRRA